MHPFGGTGSPPEFAWAFATRPHGCMQRILPEVDRPFVRGGQALNGGPPEEFLKDAHLTTRGKQARRVASRRVDHGIYCKGQCRFTRNLCRDQILARISVSSDAPEYQSLARVLSGLIRRRILRLFLR